jgi:hypothetical protein
VFFPVESVQQCAGELLSSGRNMISESVGIDEFTEVPKSTNPYVKLLVRLYKFLARKYLAVDVRGLTADNNQAEPMRPSTRRFCDAS